MYVCVYACTIILLYWIIVGRLFLFEKASCALVKPILKGKIQCLDILMGSNAGMYVYACMYVI